MEKVSISMFRPDAIIQMYWQEILDIHEDDEMLGVEFMKFWEIDQASMKTITYACRRCGKEVENPEVTGFLCMACWVEEP